MKGNEEYGKLTLPKLSQSLVIMTFTIVVLIYFESLLRPLIVAAFIWYLIYDLKKFLSKIKIKGQSLPSWANNFLALLLLILTFAIFFQIISINVEKISKEIPSYNKKLSEFISVVSAKVNDPKVLDYLNNALSKIDFAGIATDLVDSLSSVMSNLIVIIFYIIFMLLEESTAHIKLQNLFPNDAKKLGYAQNLIRKIDKAIETYINSMVLISFLTGAISYIALIILGVDFPILWAFLIFILNFIPYLGSILATLFPAVIAVFQFGNVMYFIYVLAVLMTIQMILGNFVQPKLMGKSLNISPIAVLLAFAFWGSIWGVTGMVLSVPITSIFLIILAQFPETRFISILMSENGEIGE